MSLELYECDLLFVHRDAEKETIQSREQEISEAIANAPCIVPTIVTVIPCKMSEAWLLINEEAIRMASGNPNGKTPLNLPNIRTLESLNDPKEHLISLLKSATELNKRRLKRFNAYLAIHYLSESIEDYSPLRNLDAFVHLENQIRNLAF